MRERAARGFLKPERAHTIRHPKPSVASYDASAETLRREQEAERLSRGRYPSERRFKGLGPVTGTCAGCARGGLSLRV